MRSRILLKCSTVGGGDKEVLELIDSLLNQPIDLSVIGPVLIQQPLQEMSNATAQQRKSYTDLLMKLPSSFAFSSDDTDKLVLLLKNPNISLFQSTVSIVNHFSASAKFQDDILKTDIWAVLLRRPDTARMVPGILAAFAKSRGFRVQSGSGIVPELLNMFSAETADFDRFQVGLEGLLALGLF
ncbi:hypothetical protein C8J57DRAFT_102431 [Mycena rebaudengoi]|nr:hypothetical protein C8J57DRAFT_102431 [Mycena rebaudengoi]